MMKPTLPLHALSALLAALAATLWITAASAQVPPFPEDDLAEVVEEEAVRDAFGRETPRSMVDGLIEALGAGDVEQALPYLDLSSLPEATRETAGAQLAAMLETVLDRSGEIVPGYWLSADPEGLQDDDLPPGIDVFAQVRRGEEEIPLTAHRVEGPEGEMIWLVSPEALETVLETINTTHVGFVDRVMPEAWAGIRLGGAPLSHWIALSLLVFVTLALARAIVSAVTGLAGRVPTPLDDSRQAEIAQAIRLPLSLLLACILYGAGLRLLGVSIVARSLAAPILEVAVWVSLAALVWRLVDGFALVSLEGMSRRGRLGAVSVVTLLRRAGKVMVLFLAALAIFASLGVDLTGWLAAFGLGGLAIALGAQKTIEHFVGSVSLIADRPIRVGDFCAVDGVQGTVEDIGMRSTRLRTNERTLVTIPNGVLSSARIENYGSRDHYLFKRVLNLRYETTAEQMREVLDRLRQLLLGDRRVMAEPARVRFVNFGPSSLDVEIFAYVTAVDYDEFLAIAEDLQLEILEIVPACGTSFAFPSTTVYLEGAGGSSVRSTSAASGPERKARFVRSALG